MPPHRLWMAVPIAALAGCQLIIGLDEGKLGAPGAGGAAPSTSSSSSGSGNTGGSSAASVASSSASSASSGAGGGGLVLDVIDDMEDGDGQIYPKAGRAGSWFSYNDTTGMQKPAPGMQCLPEAVIGGAPGSTKAMHTSGMNFASWGAGIGFDLNHGGAQPRMPYDASAYKGIVFWAKSDSPAPIPPLHVRLLETETVPPVEGGSCTPPDAGLQCGDSHSAFVTLTSSWQLVKLSFSDFKQEGWGVPSNPKALDPTQLLAVQFAVANVPAFDYWIDDVAFYK